MTSDKQRTHPCLPGEESRSGRTCGGPSPSPTIVHSGTSTMERQGVAMDDVNPTAAALLGLLHAGEATGYQLWDTARTFIGDFWTVTRSQAYRELARLAERGMVQAQPTRARSARPYRLTDSGRAAFAEWLAVPPGPENIRYPLLLALS